MDRMEDWGFEEWDVAGDRGAVDIPVASRASQLFSGVGMANPQLSQGLSLAGSQARSRRPSS